jgi:hypothetical protein
MVVRCALLLAMGQVLSAQDDAKLAATKAVALLQNVAAKWRMPCFSCHHQSLPTMALETARSHGIPVAESLAEDAARRTFAYLADVDAAAQVQVLIDPATSEGNSLLAAHAAGVRPSLTTALYARHIARNQRADGEWATFDSRPPQGEGLFAATAVAARAVDLYLPPELWKEKSERLGRAGRWLGKAKPETTEDLTYRLLGLHWTGASMEAKRWAAKGLLEAQRADGGWGQVASMPDSDAYSTGEALVALVRAGTVDRTDAVVRRGVAWLVRTQAADGSWLVKTRIHSKAPISPPYFESGFPYGRDQYISCAATAMAAMALAESLPTVKSPPAPLPVRGVEPATAAWMETAAFGHAEDVEGLNPALATSGGTTPLMLAADDPTKVAVLLKKGAKATTAAKSGYDALMAAVLFGGNRRTVEMLLDAGASAEPSRKIRFNATPLTIAAFTGDTDVMDLLVGRGASPSRPFQLLGQSPITPLGIAAGMDHGHLVRALVRKGAKVEELDEFGMTQVSWSALGHKDAALAALIELGANTTVKDKFGMTPVDHARAIHHYPPDTERLLAASAKK